MVVCRYGRGQRGQGRLWMCYAKVHKRASQCQMELRVVKKGCLWTEAFLALHPANVRSGPVALIHPAVV